MNRLTIFFAMALFIFICFVPAKSFSKTQQEGGLEDIIKEESGLAPRPEEVPEEEAIPEEAAPEEIPAMAPTPAAPAVRLPPEAAAREGEEARQIVIDSLVNLNYVFNNSPDSFILKYHLHLEGKVAATIAVVKGTASIATEVTGFLAKWPTGSCKLVVNIPDTPFEMIFRKSSEDKANIDLKFTNPITETWESQCSFEDAPGAKFNTKGDPEKWLAKALEKARPPLNRLTMPVTVDESTTMKFEIGKQNIKDPPLGSAEVEGTGVITINPGAGG